MLCKELGRDKKSPASIKKKRWKPLDRFQRFVFCCLHGDDAEGVGHRADKDDGRKDGTEILYHKVEDASAAEGLAVQRDLLFDLLHTDDSGHQQAGGDGRNGHHDGVGEEVEEVEELHPEDREPGQRAVTQSRQTAQHQHDDADEDGGLFAVPAQLVLEGGDGALGQGDGAGDSGEKHQRKEEDAHHRAEAHALEHLGDGDEHEGRAGLQSVRVAAGEGEDRRNDHQARHDGDGGIKDLHVFGGLLDGDVLLHIGAEGDEDAHSDGEGVEHLPHCGHDGHPREVGDVGHEKVFHTLQRARACDGVACDDDGEHHEDGHHHLGHPLHAVAHARKDDGEGKDGKDGEADLRRRAAGNEGGEIAVRRQLAAVAADVVGQIPDDPAADDRVVGDDEDGDDGVDPAAEGKPARFAEGGERAHRAFLGHPAQRRLGHDHGVAEGEGEDDVDEQEDAAAVLGRKIGKAPDVAEAHRRACSGENESDLARKGAPLVLFLIHWIFLFSQIQYPQCITAGEGIQPVFR